MFGANKTSSISAPNSISPPKKLSHFGALVIASVGQPHMGRHKLSATQLAAQADPDGCETLDLVAVRMAAYTNMTVSPPTVLSTNVTQS